MYSITVFQMDEQDGQRRRTDLAHYTTAPTAPEMEDAVTRLHKEFPEPGFLVVVAPIPARHA
jgi:hypothetical protein